MTILEKHRADVERLSAHAQAADAKVAEIDARRSALAAVQAARKLAAEQRIDRAEIEADKSPVRSLADNLARFFKSHRLEFEEMPDELLVALSQRLDVKRDALAKEAREAGVAAEQARERLDLESEKAAKAAVSLWIEAGEALVAEAAEWERRNRGRWALGNCPRPIAPPNATADFAMVGEALSSPALWQQRSREALQPHLDELRKEEPEVAHA